MPLPADSDDFCSVHPAAGILDSAGGLLSASASGDIGPAAPISPIPDDRAEFRNTVWLLLDNETGLGRLGRGEGRPDSRRLRYPGALPCRPRC